MEKAALVLSICAVLSFMFSAQGGYSKSRGDRLTGLYKSATSLLRRGVRLHAEHVGENAPFLWTELALVTA